MCDFSQGFILCKCNDPKTIVHNKKSRKAKKLQFVEYGWDLFKYKGPNEDHEIGQYKFPVSSLGEKLKAAFVVEQLNSRNCFDFDYEPSEGDNLMMRIVNQPDRMEFIFESGKWKEDHYSPFVDEIEKIDSGRMKKAESN